MSLFLIILAAGNGKRLKSTSPKPFCLVNNRTLLEHSLNRFKNISEIKKTVIVYNKKHKNRLKKIRGKNLIKIPGGKTRQQSTFLALKKISNMNCKKVLIHDSARPNVSYKIVKTIVNHLKKREAVIPAINIHDSVKVVRKNNLVGNLDRDSLKLTQTPQGFDFRKIYKKHKENYFKKFGDDSALFIKDNEKVFFINGNKNNIKITNKDDLDMFKKLIEKKLKISSGIGFDVHKLTKGRKLYIGGLKIPFHLGLQGHSDGDPVLHALIDALLGACKLGDIGKIFPDKNKKYKNVRSTILLKKIINLIKSKRFFINNVDINIIVEKPKIKKYTKKIARLIGAMCEINPREINIKGKTTERLGLIGQGKAIAAEVIVSVSNYD